MTSLLRQHIQEIKEECERLGTKITIEQTKDDSSWTLSNFGTGKAVIIGETGENKPGHYVAAFEINVARWNWAIDEGFTRDEIVSKLSGEVFKEIDMERVPLYLK